MQLVIDILIIGAYLLITRTVFVWTAVFWIRIQIVDCDFFGLCTRICIVIFWPSGSGLWYFDIWIIIFECPDCDFWISGLGFLNIRIEIFEYPDWDFWISGLRFLNIRIGIFEYPDWDFSNFQILIVVPCYCCNPQYGLPIHSPDYQFESGLWYRNVFAIHNPDL